MKNNASVKEVNSLRTRCWFNTVAHHFGTESPFLLEKYLQPWRITKDADGKISATNKWAKYKDGTAMPRCGESKDGKLGALQAAEKSVEISEKIFNHPLWHIIIQEQFNFMDCMVVLSAFDPFVRRYYYDLSLSDKYSIYQSFENCAGTPIHISENDDMIRSMDHLSLQLMMLKVDFCKFNKNKLREIAENIVLTLGAISVSPWTYLIYEELFDCLEKYVWLDLFDSDYYQGDYLDKGWRKTRSKWNLPNYRL